MASLFTGGGGWDVAALNAGMTPIWGIEMDPEIAEVAVANVGHRVLVADATTVDPMTLNRPDILVASPPCQQWSAARSKHLAPRSDGDVGMCVIDFVRTLTPRAVLVENVPPYADSPAFTAVCRELMALGYWAQWGNVNSADVGVPQTRRRLILRAARDGLLSPLTPAVPWRGWYDAIADLIPTLPESRFAEWQLRRLGWLGETALVDQANAGRESTVLAGDDPAMAVQAWHGRRPSSAPLAFLVNGTSDAGIRDAGEPAQTVNATLHEHGRPPTAFLVHNQISQSQDAPIVRDGDEPSPVVTTNSNGRLRAFFAITGTHGSPRAWLELGRVVKMTPRALARFQSFPDRYVLPDRNSLATKIIGNAIPVLLARRLLESVAS